MLRQALALVLLTGSAQAAELVPASCGPQTYTPEALRYEMEGTVGLEFSLDKDGKPVAPQLRQASGYALLDRDAIRYISSCKFALPDAPAGAMHTATVVWSLPEGRPDVAPRLLPQSCQNKYRIFTQAAAANGSDYLTVRAQVWPDGRPYTAKVEHASGEAEVDTLAVSYLEDCRFQPALRNGQPTRGAVLLTLPLDRAAFGEAKVRHLYDRIIARLALENDYKVAHILYAEEQAARTAIAAIQAGTPFGALARRESLDKPSGKVDGELGWINPNVMVAEFSTALKASTAAGLIDRPVKTAFGWHVVSVEAIRPTTTPSYDALRERLRRQLMRETDIVVQAPPAR